ncbi:hypothetical protein [Dyadobacter sandarakinus]|uniref:Uncharacterized protein n=1 Tax=Dyadobacter sandarakinus TaxID=2747268 RepID=A0ABX7I9P5_9BACT|nr:hypothetical protein [Dyadobacter sandarakinus]QRR02829.1 hypothetical protein HWI92_18865 [Dyadobacter sandarakinus]
MKNRITLVIASLLLGLCIMQKEARNKAIVNINVEKVYDLPTDGGRLAGASAPFVRKRNDQNGEKTAAIVSVEQEIASLDSATRVDEGSRLLNHNLLNIATTGKVLLNN